MSQRKDSCFVIREILGKGFGVIAARDIEEGDLIIAEEPLFVVPWWIRHSTYPKKELCKFLDRCLDELTDEQEDSFYDLSDCKCSEGAEKTELGIWKTNNFALGRSGTKSSNGIFPKLSRFNHSCVPSAEFRWNQQKRRQEIRSIRSITAGEEITLCYFTAHMLVKSRDDRRTYLRNNYGFWCSCQDCILEGSELIENDEFRHRVSELEKEIEELVYEWVEFSEDENDEQQHEEDPETEQQSILDDQQKALQLSITRLELMQKLGFKMISRLDACKKILDLSADIGDDVTTRAFAKTGMSMAKILYGACDKTEMSKWEKINAKKI